MKNIRRRMEAGRPTKVDALSLEQFRRLNAEYQTLASISRELETKQEMLKRDLAAAGAAVNAKKAEIWKTFALTDEDEVQADGTIVRAGKDGASATAPSPPEAATP